MSTNESNQQQNLFDEKIALSGPLHGAFNLDQTGGSEPLQTLFEQSNVYP